MKMLKTFQQKYFLSEETLERCTDTLLFSKIFKISYFNFTNIKSTTDLYLEMLECSEQLFCRTQKNVIKFLFIIKFFFEMNLNHNIN